MTFEDPDPRLKVTATCPRCSEPARTATTGGWSTCRCGLSWPLWPVELAVAPLDRHPDPVPTVDHVDAVALTDGELRACYRTGEAR